MAYKLRDFTRKNPPIFRGFKTSDDPQEFVDEVHKILVTMGDMDTEKALLASYQLNDVHRHGARCRRIADLSAESWSYGSCLIQPFWGDFSLWR